MASVAGPPPAVPAGIASAALGPGKKLAMSVVVLLLFFGMAEASCRLAAASRPTARLMHQRQLIVTLGFDELNEILDPDPELFWRVRPLLRDHELRGRIAGSGPLRFRVSTDERGWRISGPHRLHRSLAGARAAGTVLLLGDSCTFGVGVDDDQTWAARLQRSLPTMRVVNAGVPGYTAYQGRVLLEQTSFERQPQVVVITFGFNDGARWDGLSDLEHAQRLAGPAARLQRHSALARWMADRIVGAAPPAARAADARRPRLTDVEYQNELRRIMRWCRARRAVPIVVSWPRRKQLSQLERSWPKQRALRALARGEGVPLVDLVAEFRARGDRRLFVDAIHASPSGNALAAQAIAEAIRSERAAR